jgi:hypothetical protein
MTVIELNRFGTRIQIYDRTTDSSASYDTIVAPAEGQGTIIDLMASNPAKLTIDAAARIDGRGTIVAGAGLGGGFRLVAPFSLILDEMVFLSQTTTQSSTCHYSPSTINSCCCIYCQFSWV